MNTGHQRKKTQQHNYSILVTLNLLKCKDSSTGTKNCLKSSVKNLCPGEPSYLASTAKPPHLLNQLIGIILFMTFCITS